MPERATPPFEIITFDCYGTLIDWEAGIARAFQAEAERDGLDLEADKILAAYMAEEPAVEGERYRPYQEVLAETARRAAARLGWQITADRAKFLPQSLPDWRSFPDVKPSAGAASDPLPPRDSLKRRRRPPRRDAGASLRQLRSDCHRRTGEIVQTGAVPLS